MSRLIQLAAVACLVAFAGCKTEIGAGGIGTSDPYGDDIIYYDDIEKQWDEQVKQWESESSADGRQ